MCYLGKDASRYWNSSRALAELKRDGLDGGVAAAAEHVRRALTAADPDVLNDGLSDLGMMMAPNRGEEEASVWLAGMRRLLGDLPADILSEAIDQHVRTSKFLPTVAEIRALADPVMAARRRLFSQLDAMARLIASGADIRPAPPKLEAAPREPDRPLTADEAEETNRILERIGAATRFKPDGGRYTVEVETGRRRRPGPARMPTVADYEDLGLSLAEAEAAVAQQRAQARA